MSSDQDITLGKTNIKISPLGIGIMQWGKTKLPPTTSTFIDQNIHDIYQASLDLGVRFFDTAESYGNGRSEKHLGLCMNGKPDGIVIATKFMPYPWRVSKGELRAALTKSLLRLGLSSVDLYQMHWPIPIVPIKGWMDAMADVFADGLIKAVGVSNYSVQQVKIAQEALSKHGIPLASNQIKYSLLDRRPERNGLSEYCNKSGVTLIAYSPLERGMLTGKYSPSNIPTGFRAWRYNSTFLAKIEPLINELQEIGMSHHGKTSSQVSLNWLMAKGAVPIPGAREAAQARENAGALGWQLSSEEVARLDMISGKVLHWA